MERTRQLLPAGLAEMPPGPRLAAVLAAIDLSRLSGLDCIEVMRARHRLASHEQAGLMAAMVEVALCGIGPDEQLPRRDAPDEWSADEIRAALAWTRRAADTQLSLAWDLVNRLPAVFAALDTGRIDVPKAKVFSEWTGGLTDAQTQQICDQLLPDAPGLTTGRLSERIKKLAIALDPDWARRRYEEAVRERKVVGYRNEDGTGNVCGYSLPAGRAAAACAHIDALAKKIKAAGDARPIDHIKADLYIGMLDGSFTGRTEADIVGHMLTAAAEAADGRDDTDGADRHGVVRRLPGLGRYTGRGQPGRHARGSTDHQDGRETRDPAQHSPAPQDGGTPGLADNRPDRRHRNNQPRPGDVAADACLVEDGGAGVGGQRGGGSADGPGDDRPGATGPILDDGAAGGGSAGDSGQSSADGGSARAGVDKDDGSDGRVIKGPWPPLPPPPGAPARRAGVEIRTELTTLLGLDDHPAEIPGWGHVHADLARTLVSEQIAAEWRYAITDDDGRLLLEGITRRRPGGYPSRADAPARGGIVELQMPLSTLRRLAARPTRMGAWATVIADLARQADRHTQYDRHGCGRRSDDAATRGGHDRPDHDARRDQNAQRDENIGGWDDPENPRRDGRASAGRGGAGENSDGENSDGENSDGENSDGENSDGENSERGGRSPGRPLRRHTQIRDRSCVHPGCRAPASQTDGDHTRDWVDGGATRDENIGSLCRHDHRLKHVGGWRLSQPAPGHFLWTSRLGRHYHVRPPLIIQPLPAPIPRHASLHRYPSPRHDLDVDDGGDAPTWREPSAPEPGPQPMRLDPAAEIPPF